MFYCFTPDSCPLQHFTGSSDRSWVNRILASEGRTGPPFTFYHQNHTQEVTSKQLHRTGSNPWESKLPQALNWCRPKWNEMKIIFLLLCLFSSLKWLWETFWISWKRLKCIARWRHALNTFQVPFSALLLFSMKLSLKHQNIQIKKTLVIESWALKRLDVIYRK